MSRSIDRRSFQFHGMELYELMSQQASSLRNAQRARRQLIAVWLVNRLAVVVAAVVGVALTWTLATAANRAAGVLLAALVAMLGVGAAALVVRWFPTSALAEAGRAREKAAHAKYAGRQAALSKVSDLLRARSPKAGASV